MSARAAPTAPAEAPFRLPWPAMATTLVACVALFDREGGSLVLPVLVLVMLASYVFPQRMGNRIGECGPWLIALLLPVFLQNLVRAPSETSGLIDPSRARYSGEGAAAVLAMECWRKDPDLGGRGVLSILLSGLILMAGTSSYEEGNVRYYCIAYAIFLMLSLWSFRGQREPARAVHSLMGPRALAGTALAIALAVGLGGYVTFHTYRNELTDWGMRLLREKMGPKGDGTGLSDSPRMGSGPGATGGLTRVFLIAGNLTAEHLRGHAFSDYRSGRWGPSRDERPYVQSQIGSAASGVATDRVSVTRLGECEGELVMPLSTAGIEVEDQGQVLWGAEDGGPLKSKASVPSDYAIDVAKEEGFQGPLCAEPTGKYLQRLLDVPDVMGPEVRALAASMVLGQRRPLDKARAIEAALMQAHPYSLRFRPGGEEPLRSFLLGTRGAHCEYFAAGAVMLLRCAGIPARYVVGYYAHEGDGTGTIVVRQRDAHAWAEAWIAATGWVTIDATPAAGRPDEADEKPGIFQRASEWLQDRWAAAIRAFAGTDPRWLAGVLVALLLVLAASAVLKRRRRLAPPRPFAYSDPRAEAADLRARFEALCRERGLECAPNVPWSEFVRVAAAQPANSALDAALAAQFVRLYNAVRFGQAGPDAIAELRATLERLRSSDTAESSQP